MYARSRSTTLERGLALTHSHLDSTQAGFLQGSCRSYLRDNPTAPVPPHPTPPLVFRVSRKRRCMLCLLGRESVVQRSHPRRAKSSDPRCRTSGDHPHRAYPSAIREVEHSHSTDSEG